MRVSYPKQGKIIRFPVAFSIDYHRVYLTASIFLKPPVCQLWYYKKLVANVRISVTSVCIEH